MYQQKKSRPSASGLMALFYALSYLVSCAGYHKEAPPQPSPHQEVAPAVPLEKIPYPDRWYANAVMYEVMVRSFYDSNGDGIGDLRGLTQKLDYLNTGDENSTSDLKVDAIWLMPIFKSPSYHGYDATDYYQIDPVYGTLDDFKTLVQEAHRRGIRVLLDLVLNHTSHLHPWFQRAARSSNPNERDYYVWSQEDKEWVRPWGGGPVWHKRGEEYFYGLFWEGMPDLNYHLPAVRDEMIQIGRNWLEHGADGYRLDAIRYLYEEGQGRQADLPATHAYLKRFASEMHKLKPDAALVGEIWSDTRDVAPYFGAGDELDLAFGFDEASAIVQAVKQREAKPLAEALRRVSLAYPERRFSAPFLTNHDMPRLATLLESDPTALRQAADLLLSLPGTPFLYQGEEIGLTNGPRPGDEGKRSPMQWDGSPLAGFTANSSAWNELAGHLPQLSVTTQLADPQSLLRHYQRLLRQRKGSSALRSGTIDHIQADLDNEQYTLRFLRLGRNEIQVCRFNLGTVSAPAVEFALPRAWLEPAEIGTNAAHHVRLSLEQAFRDRGYRTNNEGAITITLPALRAGESSWNRLSGAELRAQ